MTTSSVSAQRLALAAAALGSLLVAGCAAPAGPAALAEPAPGRGPTAVARLLDAQGRPMGGASFTPAGSGVEVMVEVTGVSPGLHGFHVHENGVCGPGPDSATGQEIAFGAAGGHFDPGRARSHGKPGQPPHQAHAGELPNIEARADGTGTLRYLSPWLTAEQGKPNSVVGRSLVVHEKADDYQGQPAGNSGGRILCGVIVPAEARPPRG